MYQIVIQQIADKTLSPKASLLRKWARLALSKVIQQGELTIRIVDSAEMKELNATYRHKDYATNVLSFPFSMPEEVDLDIPLLGDIVICAEVVNKEALEQHKTQEAHWAHMIIHGIYHLMGYDHENENEADLMEALEIETLKKLGFPNPYDTTKTN